MTLTYYTRFLIFTSMFFFGYTVCYDMHKAEINHKCPQPPPPARVIDADHN